MYRPASPEVQLRSVEDADLPALFEFQRDPAANRMAAVRARGHEAFHDLWQRILRDPTISARVILADGVLVGSISCFVLDEQDSVGYWIDRAHWNRGIASRARVRGP